MIRLLRHITEILTLTACTVLLLISGCANQDPVNADGSTGEEDRVGNIPPETYLTLQVEDRSLPDISISRKVMSWWGEDQDGRIQFYMYRWGKLDFVRLDSVTAAPDSGLEFTFSDTINISVYDTTWFEEGWTIDSSETATFTVPIRSDFDVFAFQVKAVDNDGAEDPTPAVAGFPVINSPPNVEFRIQSNPRRISDTHYTYPVRTFVWDGYDPDGAETIAAYYYALDPADGDTNWIEVDASLSAVTLDSTVLTPGPHTFWLKAEDVAGFQSASIHFPDSTVITDPAEWVVKEPFGNYLIVDDYGLDVNNEDLNIYRGIFDNLYGPEGEAYSVWEINDELPYATQDVTETLKMFTRVFWYSYYGGSTLDGAFNSMYTFIAQEGNRMLLSATEIDTGMWVDIIADTVYISRLSNSPEDTVLFEPDDVADLPNLLLSETIGRSVYAFEPADNENVEVFYRLDDDTRTIPRYSGNPAVGIRKKDKSYAIICVPFRAVRGYDNLEEVFRILLDE